MRKLTLVMCVAFLGVSCKSAGTPAAPAPQSDTTTAASRAPRRTGNVITQDEINASSARDAYHAVQLLRPDWLRRGRGASSMRDTRPQPVIVYVDGQRYGDVRTLEQFRMGSFKELRYYSGSEATNRWGTGHGGGVIYLSSR